MGYRPVLGSALYYPFIDVRDRDWLRSAILFWDEIRTIVPSAIKAPYQHADTKICEQEGYLRPLRCDLHPGVLEELGKKVIELLEQPDWLRALVLRDDGVDPSVRALRESERVERDVREEFHIAGIYPEKLSPELRASIVKIGAGRLHPGKLPPSIKRLLEDENPLGIHPSKLPTKLKELFGYRREYEGDWLLVDRRFASVYMTALAAMLAKEENLSPLTTREAFQGVNLRYLIDDVAGDEPGVLLTFVMRSLRIDPETPVQKLIAFRRARNLQLAELSATFDKLRVTMEGSETPQDLQQKASRVMENEIQPALDKLKKELFDQAIQSAWSAVYQAATVTAASGSALAMFGGLSAATLLGAGAFLTVTDVGIKTAFARRKARATSPYTYLLDIERKFSLPVWMR